MRIPVTDQVRDQIRFAILNGTLKPGEAVGEHRIGQMLNASRTPVREALRELATEGLVEWSAMRGARITPFDDRHLRESLALRTQLEPWAARIAASSDPADIEELRAALVRAEEFSEADDDLESNSAEVVLDKVQAGYDFHRAVVRATGNELLFKTLQQILQAPIVVQVVQRDTNHYRSSQREHRLIFEAIAAGDGDLAAERMRGHLDRWVVEVTATSTD